MQEWSRNLPVRLSGNFTEGKDFFIGVTVSHRTSIETLKQKTTCCFLSATFTLWGWNFIDCFCAATLTWITPSWWIIISNLPFVWKKRCLSYMFLLHEIIPFLQSFYLASVNTTAQRLFFWRSPAISQWLLSRHVLFIWHRWTRAQHWTQLITILFTNSGALWVSGSAL